MSENPIPSRTNTSVSPTHASLPLTIFLEGVFVIFFLCLIFFVLNFFNVISLSSVVPQLGFLPQRTQTRNPQMLKKLIQSSFITPTPPLFPQEENILLATLRQVVPPSYLPQDSITHGVFHQDTPVTFVLQWGVNGSASLTSMGATARAEIINKTGVTNLAIQIASSDTVSAVSASNSSSIIHKYFSAILPLQWTCTTQSTSSTCIAKKLQDATKIQITTHVTSDIPGKMAILYCEVTSKSPMYNQSNYCLL